MNSNGEKQRDLISIGEASSYLGVSIDTLRRWEKRGKITSLRSPGGHRYFEKDKLDEVFGTKYERDEHEEKENEKVFETQPPFNPIPLKMVSFSDAPPFPFPIATTMPSFQTEIKTAPQEKPEESDFFEKAPENKKEEEKPVLSQVQQDQLEEIISTDKKKKKIVIKTGWIIAALLVFTIVDLVLVYIWFSSSTIVSPVP